MIDEEEFYASIKLKTGEEIFSKVSPSDEGDKIFLILEHPVTIKEISIKNNSSGYKIEPWIKTSDQDIFLISMNDVLTVSESSEDSYFIDIYLDYLKKARSNKKNTKSSFKTRKMGYISNVADAKKILEKIYKDL
jgi:hypothetical protein